MRKALVLVSLLAIVSITIAALLVVYAPAGGSCAPAEAAVVGDPVRGAKLHQGCFGCHGIERYTAPITHASASFADSLLRASGLSDMPPAQPPRFRGRIGSLGALRDAVQRRNERLESKLAPQDVEDLVAYLNATYYRFPSR